MGDQDSTRGGDVDLSAVLSYLLDNVHPEGRAAYSVVEVAAGTGLSESTVKHLRSGKKDNPTLGTLERIAKFFAVPTEVWVNPKGPEWVIARHGLDQAMVDADVLRIAMRAGGLDAENMRFLVQVIDKARQAQGLGPANGGLDLSM